MQGTWVWSLIWKDSTCCIAINPEHYSYWAHTPQLPSPHAIEPMLCSKRGYLQWEAPAPQLKRSPKLPELEKVPEKAMAPHSSALAWKIPWTEEPGGLQSMGSQRVGHDWATSLSLFTFMHWRKKSQPTAVFLSGESQGWESLVGCRLWGRTESDMTEVT